jgi:hypothetical protein
MYMWMEAQILAIGMKDGDDARFCTQPFFICTQLVDGMMAGIKQQIKEERSVIHYYSSQLLGQRKYQVIVSGGQ